MKGVVLMLRSYSPIGSLFVSKEAMSQLLGRRNRQDFWVLEASREMQGEGESSPILEEKMFRASEEV